MDGDPLGRACEVRERLKGKGLEEVGRGASSPHQSGLSGEPCAGRREILRVFRTLEIFFKATAASGPSFR